MSQFAAMNQFVAHDGIYMLSHSVGLPLVGGSRRRPVPFGSHGSAVMPIYGITGWQRLLLFDNS